MIVHGFALAVPIVIAPLGARLLGRRHRVVASVVAGVAATPTFAFHRGVLAAMWVAPWVALSASWAARDVGGVMMARRPTRSSLAIAAASVFLATAAASLLLSRLGVSFGRLYEPIVELTAVHYGVAGYAATLLAACAADEARPNHRVLADLAVVATIASPPIVALGFLTGNALPQVGGAAVLTVGVWSTAVVTARDARPRTSDRSARLLLLVCAAAPVAPMVLAVMWAAAQHWALPALDIPAMARLHGSVNAIGFVGCGLVGYRRLRVAAARGEMAQCC